VKIKKILSFVMAGAFAMGLSAPTAGAAETNLTTEISALCRLPDVRVTVPTTGMVYINPFKIPVDIGTGEAESGQILSVPESIANESEVPIMVNVTVTGTLKEGSSMGLNSSTTKDTGLTSKRAFIYFEMKAVGPDDDLNSIAWDAEYDPDKHVLVKGIKRKNNILKLAAADEDGNPTEGGVGAFHLTGDAVETPKIAWTDKDGVNVEIAFTFKPVSLIE